EVLDLERGRSFLTAESGVFEVKGEHTLNNFSDRITHREAVVAESFGLDPLDSGERTFWSHNFFWRDVTVAQDFADAGARNVQAIPGIVVGDRLGGGMNIGPCIVKHFVEEANVDAEFFFRVLTEDGVSGIFIVVVSDPGMVSSDEGVRTAVIFHDQSMQDGFSWSRENVGDAQRR